MRWGVLAFVLGSLFGSASDAHVRASQALPGGDAPTLNSVRLTPTTFDTLGTPTDGLVKACANCTETNPCNSGGDGALAVANGERWKCN